MKGENSGEYSLSSKTFVVFSAEESKISAKAAQKNKLPPNPHELFKAVLTDKQSRSVVNAGFSLHEGKIHTYFMKRFCFSYLYVKRRILSDGIRSVPLDIVLTPALLEKAEEKEEDFEFCYDD